MEPEEVLSPVSPPQETVKEKGVISMPSAMQAPALHGALRATEVTSSGAVEKELWLVLPPLGLFTNEEGECREEGEP